MPTEATHGITWKKLCGSGLDLRLSALGFAMWTNLLTILYAANATNLFSEVTNSAAVALVCLILFVLAQTALLVRIFNPKLWARDWLWLIVLIIAAATHVELNMYLLQNVSKENLLGEFYPSHSSLVTGITYITLGRLSLQGRWESTVWFIPFLASCRQPYRRDTVRELFSAFQCLVYLSILTGTTVQLKVLKKPTVSLHSLPANTATKIEYSESRVAEPINLNSLATSRNLCRYKTAVTSLQQFQRTDDFTYPIASSDRGITNTRTIDEKTLFKESDQTLADSKITNLLSALNHEFEYGIAIGMKDDEIRHVVKRCHNRQSIDLYESIQFKLQEDIPVKMVEVKHEKGQNSDSESSLDEEQIMKMSPQQRGFRFSNYDKTSKTIHLTSTHNTLNDMIRALKVEYSKRDSKPFSKFLNRTHLSILKSKTSNQRIEKEGSEINNYQRFNSSFCRDSVDGKNSPKAKGQAIIKSGSTVIGEGGNIEIKARIKLDFQSYRSSNNIRVNLNDPSNHSPQKIQTAAYQIETIVMPLQKASESKDAEPITYLAILFLKTNRDGKKPKTTEMLNLIAHEMRSPLVAIEGLMKLFINKTTPMAIREPQLAGYINNYLFKGVIHLRNLLDACQMILELSKNKNGKEVVKTTEFEVRKLLSETVRLFEKIVEGSRDKDITLKWTCDVRISHFIKSDPVRLRQILINLVSNSVKYTKKGTITLEATFITFKRIRFTIRDTGIGIKKEDLDKLFKEFGRIRNKDDEILNEKGVGLGLVLSNQLAWSISPAKDRSGITVSSEYGRGSEFSFVVENQFDNPIISLLFENMDAENIALGLEKKMSRKMTQLSQIANDQGQSQDSQMRAEEKLKMLNIAKDQQVLVVDDSELNLEVTEAIFQNYGFSCCLSSDPNDGLDIINSRLKLPCEECRVFDLIVVDMEMPFMDGNELAGKIRKIKEYEIVPIICISANQVEKVRSKHFTAVMEKPFSSADVEIITTKYLKSKTYHNCDSRKGSSMEKSRSARNFLNFGELILKNCNILTVDEPCNVVVNVQEEVGILNNYNEDYVKPVINPNLNASRTATQTRQTTTKSFQGS